MQKCKIHASCSSSASLYPPAVVSTPVLEGPWKRTLGDLNLNIPVLVTKEQKWKSHSSHPTGRITQRKTLCRYTLVMETDFCVQCQNYPKFLKEGIMQCSLPIDSNVYFKCTAEECATLKTETWGFPLKFDKLQAHPEVWCWAKLSTGHRSLRGSTSLSPGHESEVVLPLSCFALDSLTSPF